MKTDTAKVHAEIESWIRDNIPVEELGRRLKEGLDATKLVTKAECDDYAVRLAYIDWIATNGKYIPERKQAGGVFSMPAPSEQALKKVFNEKRPEAEDE